MAHTKATILAIGTELLIGQTINTNAAWLGEQLFDLGIETIESVTIDDNHNDIIKSIKRLQSISDIVLITGGLGPTKDDITKVAIAEYLGQEMYYDDTAYQRIVTLFEQKNLPLSPLHKAQCYFPSGVTLLENRLGTAPGMLFQHNDTKIISMPGVPYEMKSIFTHEIVPIVLSEQSDTHFYKKTILTVGTPESKLADTIEPILADMPSHLAVAYLPCIASVRIRISGYGKDVKQQIDTYAAKIDSALAECIYGHDDYKFEQYIQDQMIKKGLTLGTAESCTGGYLSHLLTAVPGSSEYFIGSTIAYANSIKTNVLNVSSKTLDTYGAVSEQCVSEMVTGALKLLGVDIAIAISGIAGPSGGTPDKPVGTIWICVGDKSRQITKCVKHKTDRLVNIRYAANIALIMLRKFLQGV